MVKKNDFGQKIFLVTTIFNKKKLSNKILVKKMLVKKKLVKKNFGQKKILVSKIFLTVKIFESLSGASARLGNDFYYLLLMLLIKLVK